MVDRWIGRVLDTIDRLGLCDNTIVIIVSDHGFGLGEHNYLGKKPMYPETNHTMLMVRHPQGIGSGKRISTIAQHPDLTPSLLDMLGIAEPAEMEIQGKSWFPVLKGEKRTHRSAAISGTFPTYVLPGSEFSRFIGPKGGWTGITATSKDWWLIDNPDPDLRSLYDLNADPACLHDILADNLDVYEKLHGEILTHIRRSKSPAWVRKLWIDGDDSVRPPTPTAWFNPVAFNRGRPHANPLDGNITPPK